MPVVTTTPNSPYAHAQWRSGRFDSSKVFVSKGLKAVDHYASRLVSLA